MSLVVQNENSSNDELIISSDPEHPANLICELCRLFYKLNWVTGTGGGVSIRSGKNIYLAPSGVQKERIKPEDMFVMDIVTQKYIRSPISFKPSACTPLFLTAYEKQGAGCCIHTHSQSAVLITLLAQSIGDGSVFEIEHLEQIKGIRNGPGKPGSLSYWDKLRVPIIENVAHEDKLTPYLNECLQSWPDTWAVLVRNHGVYVWGDDWIKAKVMCECFDYIFQLAIEMHKLGLPWVHRSTIRPEKYPE